MSLNLVELEGAIVRDPELRFMPSGKQLCEFLIVTNGTRWNRERNEAEVTSTFLSCTVWGELAEEFVEQVRKSDRVYVKGTLDRRLIEKDGRKEEKTRVNVMFWQPTMLHPKQKVEGGAPF